MTRRQKLLLSLLFAVGLPIGNSLKSLDAGALTDWNAWLVGVGIAVAQAVGVWLIAAFTTGGLSVPDKPTPLIGG